MPAGYTIPVVDLSGQVERQVVVDREAGQYLGHPTTVLLEDNKTMLIVYPKGHGRGGIVMKRSTDAGLTWSERLPTPENWATSQEVPTLYRVIDSQGTKRLVMFSGVKPTLMAVSQDDGLTWSPLEDLPNMTEYSGIVAMADLIRLEDGRYMAFFHQRRDNRKPSVYAVISADGGLTWTSLRQLTSVFGQCYGSGVGLSGNRVVIAHDHQAAPTLSQHLVRCEQTDHPVLRMVGVLILVHAHVPETVLVRLAHFGVFSFLPRCSLTIKLPAYESKR